MEDAPNPRSKIRVIAEIDGRAYSIPSREVWFDTASVMTPESFPLPLDVKSHHVRFSVLEQHPTSASPMETAKDPWRAAATQTYFTAQYMCERLDSVSITQLPFRSEYDTYFFDTVGGSKAPNHKIKITYKIDYISHSD